MKNFIGNLPKLIIICHLAYTPGFANPSSPQVIQGSATFSGKDGMLTVTNSNGAIINWNSFSISPGEITRFIQSSPDSSVLNRIVGPDPSLLLGGLYSNGKVFLQNPSGIIVGEGAKIDVAGFVATNLNINLESVKSGNLIFEPDNATRGKIENLGAIRTPDGGNVYLIGSEVSNQGLIETPKGEVILAAGHSVELHDTSTPNLAVVITGKDNRAANLGQIIASSGQVGIVGALVRNSGVINANQMIKGEGGRIYLTATRDLKIANASRISADGNLSAGGSASGGIILQSDKGNIAIQTGAAISANGVNGGEIKITADQGNIAMAGNLQAMGSSGNGGEVNISGIASDTAKSIVSANSTATAISGNIKVDGANGGDMTITGNRVDIVSDAKLQADGQNNGGNILIGGGEHGQDSAIPNAQTTFVARGTVIDANGGIQPATSAQAVNDESGIGNGGHIVIWSDLATQVHGSLSATGGGQGGDGGFIETSGGQLDILGIHVNASAAHGQSGEWLLDPNGLTIAGSPGAGVILNTDLENQLDNGSSIVLQTSGTNGDININSPIAINYGGVSSLTLNATANININANIIDTSGKLNLSLNPNTGSGSGGTSSIANGANIDLNGGALDFNHGLALSGALQNARIDSNDNSPLTSSNGVLDGITIASDLNVGGGTTYIINDLTLANGVTLNIGAANWYFQGGDQNLTATGNATLTVAGGSLNLTGGAQTLTLGEGLTVNGYGVLGNNQNNENIVNHGVITANADSRPLTINAGSFTNYGGLSAESGILNMEAMSFGNYGNLSINAGTLLILSDNWYNNGVIAETGGVLNLGGNFTTAGLGIINRGGGELIISGVLDNSNNTLDIGAARFGFGGLSNLYGSIVNGKIISTDGTVLHSSFGTLDNVDIDSNLTLADSSYLFVKNSLTLSNGTTLGIGNSTISFLGNGVQEIVAPGNAILALAGGGLSSFSSAQTLEIGLGIIIGGFGTLGGTNQNTIINNGVISPSAPAGFITSPISIPGNYQQTGSGALDLNLNSTAAAAYPGLMVNGSATLNGAVNLTGITNISDYSLLKAAAVSGSFSSINAGGLPVALYYTPTAATLIYQGTFPSADQTATNYLSPYLLNLSNFYAQTVVAATYLAIYRTTAASTRTILSLLAQPENTFKTSTPHISDHGGDF